MSDQVIWCDYDGVRRRVHPAVCEWHARENDPKCREAECLRFGRLRKELETHAGSEGAPGAAPGSHGGV